MANFLQPPPAVPDAWASDRALREAIEWHLGDELLHHARPHLEEMGRIATEPATIALALQADKEPPVHVPYSAWGERIDDIKVSPAYYELGRIGVEAGVTSLPYEDGELKEKARVFWAGMMLLWAPSSAMYGCPVAMTDAAARTLLLHGGEEHAEVVERLTTRDFPRAWTSGQWMTETAGGSDVGRTGTVARRDEQGSWRLYGTKWFTSSTTSETALTLARPEGSPEGSRGLGLFRVDRVLESGERNSIIVRRLKDKLGTRALPTAELELEGALALPVGDPLDGGGVRRISTMLNITRIHNALGSAGAMGRGLAIARAFARVRSVFGSPLHTLPAHQATLSELATNYSAALALVLRCCALTGRAEQGTATDDELAILRGLTPVTKLATARWAVEDAAEAMEALGGVGYCEDSGMPALVRDTHVMPIWEGTTNVLSLDLLRAEHRSGALTAVLADASEMAQRSESSDAVAATSVGVRRAITTISERVQACANDLDRAQAEARSIALGVARIYACASLCAQGAWAAANGDGTTALAAGRVLERGLVVPAAPDLRLAFG
jgi:alkylation response protein AidB-like acyl-CoA dehydrogenase